MAGTGLVAIKRRIKSITNTNKITKAMGLVATSKYKKVRDQVDINNKYLFSLQETMKQIKDNYEEDSIFIQGNNNVEKLYIILTADTGLCGGFNASVVNEMMDRVKKNNESYKIIIIGNKGRNIFKKLNIETVSEYVEISDTSSQKEAASIVKDAINMYISGAVGEVYIVYKKLISALTNEVKIEKLLPLNFYYDENDIKESVDIEVIDDAALNELVLLYLNGKMLNSMLHSKASEHKARMESMGAATNNANELLKKLNLSYNRIRQSAITQEIAEIVGGAEAQK
jgi:F-type H+-transporting ATPase subunit gamma